MGLIPAMLVFLMNYSNILSSFYKISDIYFSYKESSIYFSNNGGVCTVPHENSSYLCQMKALIAKLTGSKY